VNDGEKIRRKNIRNNLIMTETHESKLLKLREESEQDSFRDIVRADRSLEKGSSARICRPVHIFIYIDVCANILVGEI